jgi:hypothetical protein
MMVPCIYPIKLFVTDAYIIRSNQLGDDAQHMYTHTLTNKTLSMHDSGRTYKYQWLCDLPPVASRMMYT